MTDKYFYLIWTGIFGVVWLYLYWRRSDVRFEMLIVSSLFGFGGIISEIVYTFDWWKPITITGTKIGIEDFLIGAFIGGIAAVVYEEIYGRRVKIKRKINLWKLENWYFAFMFGFLFLLLFYVFRLSSIYATYFAYLMGITYMLYLRPDLIDDSLISGLFMLMIGSGIYWIMGFIRPGFFHVFWYLPHGWYSKLVWGIPLGEYTWYLLTGMFIGPLYVFCEKGKLIKAKVR